MAELFAEAEQYVQDLSNSYELAKSFSESTNGDDETTSIPKGLQSFLATVYDKTAKLAIPVMIGGVSAGVIVATGGAAAPVVAIMASTLKVGDTMVKSYKERNSIEKRSNEVSSCATLYMTEQFSHVNMRQDALASSVAELGAFTYSAGQHLVDQVDTVLKKLDGIDSRWKRFLDKDDEYIETAYKELERKLAKGNYISAKSTLESLNFVDMYIRSNTTPSKAKAKIVEAFKKESEEAAINEFQKLLVIRNKLELMRRLNCFFKDYDSNKLSNMEEYLKHPAETFLEDLEEYFQIMRQFLSDKGKWNVPTVLILGKTGTGKSTLCNVLAGKSPDLDVSHGGFPVSESVDACTKKTTFGDFFYAGDLKRPVTIIDTPGFDDPTKNHDAVIISDLVETLAENFGGIHQILIAVNGTNPRLDGSMKAMIDIFQGMFTEKIWDHIGIVFTKLSMDRKQVKKREKQRKNHDQLFAEEYVAGLKKTFNYKGEKALDTFFIDSHYENDDDNELAAFNAAVDNLWYTIKKKEIFPTDYVQKVMTEYDSLKEELKKKEKQFDNTTQILRNLQKKELTRIKIDKEESRASEFGFAFCKLKGINFTQLLDYNQVDVQGHVRNYQELVRLLAGYNKLYPFDSKAKSTENDYMICQQSNNSPVERGLVMSDTTNEQICKHNREHSLVVALEIENRTKYFMNGVDFFTNASETCKPSLFYSEADGFKYKLDNFNTFVIPPYTIERLIFPKKRLILAKLNACLTFSLGNFPPTKEVKRIMVMFHVAGKGKNSFAVGFPKTTFNSTDSRQVFQTTMSGGEYYSKGFQSHMQEKSMLEHGCLVHFPPEHEKVPGDFEIGFNCGNGKKCIGIVRLKKTPERKHLTVNSKNTMAVRTGKRSAPRPTSARRSTLVEEEIKQDNLI